MSPAVDRSAGKAEVKGEDEVERVLRVVVERHRKKKEAAAEVAKRIAADARDLSALRRLSADPTSTERLSIPAKFFSRLAKQLSKEEDLPTQQAEEEEEEEEAKAAGATKKKSKKQQQAAEQPTELLQQQQQQDQPLKKTKKSKKESTEDNNNNNDEDNTASKKRKREQPKEAVATPKKAKPSGKQGGGVQKQFYQPTKATLSMTAAQVDDFRRAHNVTLTGNDVASFKPILSFADSTFSSQLLACCKDFAAPTTIQSECWPVILSGRDIIGVAATGSGKTIAFVLPSLVHIMAQRPVSPSDRGPVALVLAPTRELACQIDQVYASCTPSTGMRSVCVYGGVPKNEQRKALRSGVEVVVGTPGRVQDLIQEGSLSTSRVTFLVLDEADRMLDLGFEEPIKFIVGSICPVGERQTVMFSATWPKAIQDLAAQYFSDPVKVTIGSQELAACKSVTQKVEVIEPFAKDQRLDALLRQYHKSRKNRVLVFVLYKKEAVRVESMLMRKGWTAVAIHGDLSQYARTEAISKFKDGTCPLLIATDVAARGLDIPDVEYVINYSFPLTIEDYIHRIGRTGRAGKTGLSHTLFTSFDKARAGELVNILKEANQEVPADLEKFGPTISKRKEHAMYGAHYKPLEGVSAKATHIKFD